MKAKASWQCKVRGLTWKQMPGQDRDCKLLNFALFRRGLFEPEGGQTDEELDLAWQRQMQARRDLRAAQRREQEIDESWTLNPARHAAAHHQ